MIKLQQILTFVAVYQERSFTAAAERIHATQSGVSMQIKELEERVGVRLFERSPRGVEATAAGRKLYAHALEVVRQVDGLREEMRLIRGEFTGRVSVGVMPTFARSSLAKSLAEFAAEWPYVDLHVVEDYSVELTEMVSREQLDFAIVPPTTDAAGIRATYIARDREFLVTSVRSPLRHLEPVCMRDVGAFKLIRPSERNARRRKLDLYLETLGLEATATLDMDSVMGTIHLVEESDWYAILPGTLCHSDLDGKSRKLHPLMGPELSHDYVLITPATVQISPAARELADSLTARIRQTCEAWDSITSVPEPRSTLRLAASVAG
jgi:DNA-binding transcriptional LysR family regulator